MQTIITGNPELLEYVLNVVFEAEGEEALFDKLRPCLLSEEEWVRRNVVGAVNLSDDALRHARAYVANSALVKAIPSLDLVFTPNGFGVVNTNDTAPASKERVERLRTSCGEAADRALKRLVTDLYDIGEWTEGPFCAKFNETLVNILDIPREWNPSDLPAWEAWEAAVGCARNFERKAAEEWLGEGVVSKLMERNQKLATHKIDAPGEALQRLLSAEGVYMHGAIRERESHHYSFYRLLRPVVAALLKDAELRPLWEEEMGDAFGEEPFKNDRKGGYWF